MFARYAFVAFSATLAILLVALCSFNMQPASFNIFGSQMPLPLALPMLAALLVGGLTGFSAAGLAVGKSEGTVRKLEWQAQDAKLAVEVRSDREKQLEAKIATLETALKQALKKV